MRQMLFILLVSMGFHSAIACAQHDGAKGPFETAEKYHMAAEFEDAGNWYRMVIRDFPDSPLAAEAAMRVLILDSTLCLWEIEHIAPEIRIAGEKQKKWYQSSEFSKVYLNEALVHMLRAKESWDRCENSMKQLAQDYDILLERYLGKYASKLWTIPGIPVTGGAGDLTFEERDELLSRQGLNLDVSDYLSLSDPERVLKVYRDFEPFWLKIDYNSSVGQVSINRRLDKDQLRYIVGMMFYDSKGFHERGVQELKELIESIDDPYSEIRYKAKETLDGTPFFQTIEEKLQE